MDTFPAISLLLEILFLGVCTLLLSLPTKYVVSDENGLPIDDESPLNVDVDCNCFGDSLFECPEEVLKIDVAGFLGELA